MKENQSAKGYTLYDFHFHDILEETRDTIAEQLSEVWGGGNIE